MPGSYVPVRKLVPDFGKLGNAWANARRQLPAHIGQEARRFFIGSFERQGFIDESRQPWPARRSGDNYKRGKSGSITRRSDGSAVRGRALLIKSGRLWRSIRITSATWQRIEVATDVPYAEAHNEGFKGPVTQTVRPHTRTRIVTARVARTNLKTRKTTTSRQRLTAGTIKVRGFSRTLNMNIPRRRFMGNSAFLNKRIARLIDGTLDRLSKSL